jgi:hypothetical protein
MLIGVIISGDTIQLKALTDRMEGNLDISNVLAVTDMSRKTFTHTHLKENQSKKHNELLSSASTQDY